MCIQPHLDKYNCEYILFKEESIADDLSHGSFSRFNAVLSGQTLTKIATPPSLMYRLLVKFYSDPSQEVICF